MIRSIRSLWQVWFLVLALSPLGGAFGAPRTEHVFIISIDGGSPAVMQGCEMPHLKRMAKEGACSWTATTVIPLTLPAHTSMLTGVGTNQHQIVWNGWVPTNGLVACPTVFSAAKAAGYSTAMFVGKEKFQHLLLPGTVDHFDYHRAASTAILKSDSGDSVVKKEGSVLARIVATNAAAYILQHKPQLCFIHFTDPDTVGHTFGWGSKEQRKALADTDAALGIVFQAIRKAGLAKRSVVLLSADHGGHGKGHSKGTLEDVTIPWIAWGQGVRKRYEIPGRVSNRDIAATALWLLDVPPSRPMEGVPVTSAFK